MAWRVMGWMLAKLMATVCVFPWMDSVKSDVLGRAMRSLLPWRLSSECSRALASGAGARLEISWLVMALFMSIGLVQLAAERATIWGLVGLVFGCCVPWTLSRARHIRRVELARGQLWLAMLSSSELGGSMGHWPAGPASGRSVSVRGRQGGHAGFIEMARRLAHPLEVTSGPESARVLRARVRLRAMMLACAGSEVAARWLWNRRKSQWSMVQWGKSLGEGTRGTGERWELAAAVMSIATTVMVKGGLPLSMDASEATETSIPMLWACSAEPARWSEGDEFEVGVRRECLRVAVGEVSAPSAWGWRVVVEEGAYFKKEILKSLCESGPAWQSLLSSAHQLLVQEQLTLILVPDPKLRHEKHPTRL